MRKEIEEYEVEVNDDRYTFSRDKFIEFMEHMELALSSNGILYMTNKLGVIPEILDKWFEQRKEYRKLMVKYAQSGEPMISASLRKAVQLCHSIASFCSPVVLSFHVSEVAILKDVIACPFGI